MRVFWFIFGLISLALGLIGVLLPLVPTIPFLLLAAFAFSQSSERLHDWLLNHPRLGPPIHDWRDHGVISKRAKILALGSILLSWLIPFSLGVRPLILTIQAVVLVAVATFILSRPDSPR